MPRFNINVRTESHIADTLVVEMDDLAALRLEVARFVGELLKDHAEQLWADQDWRVDASDESGLILFVIHIFASTTAATKPGRPTI